MTQTNCYNYIIESNVATCDELRNINGAIIYTPPRDVSGNSLPAGQRYMGTIATYSCSPGYQLVGGSLRACGPSGTWNGTQPSCEGKLYSVSTNYH